jgi:hypothetical protein
MPKPTNTKTLPNTTAKPVVANAVHSVTADVMKAFTNTFERRLLANTAKVEASDALKGATDNDMSVKEALMRELADLAIKGNWDMDHAKEGMKAAIAAYKANDPKTVGTLTQFAKECERVIHPLAREHVADAFDEAQRLWDAEGAKIAAADKAVKDAKEAGEKIERPHVDTPLRDAFKRKWHMVVGSTGLLASRASDSEARSSAAVDAHLLADVVVHDERTDATRAARAIKRAVDTIEDIAAEFPSDRWDTVIRFLSALDPKSLKRMRDVQTRQRKLEARERRPQGAHRTAPVTQPSAEAQNDAADDILVP